MTTAENWQAEAWRHFDEVVPLVVSGMQVEATPVCVPCAHTAIHHWWGDSSLSHCRKCHASWRIGTRTTHCVGCCETFTTPGVLEVHKRNGVVCVPPGEVVDSNGNPRLRAVPNAYGTLVWRNATERPDVHQGHDDADGDT